MIQPKVTFTGLCNNPMEIRIQNVAFYYKVTPGETEKRIANRETKRKTFIKRNFRKNVENLMHYDLVIITERMDLETCTEMVIGAIKGAQTNRAFEKATSYILKTMVSARLLRPLVPITNKSGWSFLDEKEILHSVKQFDAH